MPFKLSPRPTSPWPHYSAQGRHTIPAFEAGNIRPHFISHDDFFVSVTALIAAFAAATH